MKLETTRCPCRHRLGLQRYDALQPALCWSEGLVGFFRRGDRLADSGATPTVALVVAADQRPEGGGPPTGVVRVLVDPGSRQRVLEAKLQLDKERWLVPGMHVEVLVSPDRTRFDVDWDTVPTIEERVAANDPTLADPAGALREVAHALGYTQADTGTSRAEHFEVALQEAARQTSPPGKVRAVIVIVAMRGAMGGASGPDLIGSSEVSFQLRNAAVVSVNVPGRAAYAVYLRRFRFPRKARTDYTGAGYPALVSESDPNDVEVLWDEVPSVGSQLSDRIASSMAAAESRRAAMTEQWQAALGQAGADAAGGGISPEGGGAFAGAISPEMRKLAAESARRALQYVQDPGMRKTMIEQYRAAGIEIPEDG